jgi:hypothetical protein
LRLEVISSYCRVAANLAAIAEMSNRARLVGPLIQAVADGAKPNMNTPPQVGLVIFGFDADQKRKGGIGDKHLTKLKELLAPQHVLARGEADGLKLR